MSACFFFIGFIYFFLSFSLFSVSIQELLLSSNDLEDLLENSEESSFLDLDTRVSNEAKPVNEPKVGNPFPKSGQTLSRDLVTDSPVPGFTDIGGFILS